MTILGTRPEIIRLSIIMKKLDNQCDHIMVHTGQNHSPQLKDVFFKELSLREPDEYMGAESSVIGEQLGRIMIETDRLIKKHQPDAILQLGDTNSGLSVIVAEKMGIPVFHMEAGNRCYDEVVPEEKNRRIIDTISRHCLPYTPGSHYNLIREGVPENKIFTSGNPIHEVLSEYAPEIDRSTILEKLSLQPNKYFLVTTHRAENVDNEDRLRQIFRGLDLVATTYCQPIICSIHPRTKEKMERYGVKPVNELVILNEPFGFFDFVKLEKNARCTISDSGTVQEECCLFRVPAVTIRKTTERPETIACGSNRLSDLNGEQILKTVTEMLARSRDWEMPVGYVDPDVSDKVISYIFRK